MLSPAAAAAAALKGQSFLGPKQANSLLQGALSNHSKLSQALSKAKPADEEAAAAPPTAGLPSGPR